MKNIESLLFPKSIALINASGHKARIGHTILQYLESWPGPLYLVNPKEQEIMGRRAYADVSDLPDAVDLAIITVEAHRAVDAAKKCAEKGFGALIILASGFSEVDEEGMRLELELKEHVIARGTRLLGPNTLGLFIPGTGLDTIFVEHGDRMFAVPGDVTFITQSGSVGVEALGVSGIIGGGLRAFIGMGNRSDVGENELLAYFAHDDRTRCIAVYLETFQNGLAFIDLCRKITPRKPVVVLKAGRSDVAQRAIASHTGKMASPVDIFYGTGKQAGIILAKNEEQLTDYAKILSREPPAADPGVAIVTFAGGYGIITLDLISEANVLEVACLSDETVSRIKQCTPHFASVMNPIDLTASADNIMMAKSLEALEEDPSVGIIFCIAFFAPLKIDRGLIEILAAHRSKTKKPFVVFVAYGPFTDEIAHTLYDKGVTVFTSLSRAVRAMDILAQRGRYLQFRQ
ncbi:MAG: CoA-binding protein [Deltaproteobacteria bacterium]|nr:CoA-binding protein [Deltaproteobacteria bacterium]